MRSQKWADLSSVAPPWTPPTAGGSRHPHSRRQTCRHGARSRSLVGRGEQSGDPARSSACRALWACRKRTGGTSPTPVNLGPTAHCGVRGGKRRAPRLTCPALSVHSHLQPRRTVQAQQGGAHAIENEQHCIMTPKPQKRKTYFVRISVAHNVLLYANLLTASIPMPPKARPCFSLLSARFADVAVFRYPLGTCCLSCAPALCSTVRRRSWRARSVSCSWWRRCAERAGGGLALSHCSGRHTGSMRTSVEPLQRASSSRATRCVSLRPSSLPSTPRLTDTRCAPLPRPRLPRPLTFRLRVAWMTFTRNFWSTRQVVCPLARHTQLTLYAAQRGCVRRHPSQPHAREVPDGEGMEARGELGVSQGEGAGARDQPRLCS